MNKKFYITTAIPYVNANPHIGFAMEAIQTDAVTRYYRMKGYDTWFLTGSDEHGTKIVKTAEERGVDVKELADGHAQQFRDLKGVLNLSFDDFIRTSDERHKKGAQKLWKKMDEKGDIYKDTYTGLYCSGCEAYVTEKELVDGKCPHHLKEPEKLSEDNYFFKLSKYSEKIGELIKNDTLKVIPASRKHEILKVIEGGLRDVSFSRPKSILPWGIEVPGDEDQVMYVWGDALSNYITAMGYADDEEKFNKYWPADAHVIGKDILRFHAAIWIGMLLSAELEIPKAIYVHGFITSEGQKMSKSLGNVVDPIEIVDQYGVDPVRYYLLREIPTTDDGDFSKERFEIIYRSELANNVGNLLHRVTAMTARYFEGRVPEVTGDVSHFESLTADVWKTYQEKFEAYDLKAAVEAVGGYVDEANRYIEEMKPWALAKTDQEKLAEVMYVLLEMVRHISYFLTPYIPAAAEEIQSRIGVEWEQDFETTIKWGGIKSGVQVMKGDPLFPRLDEEA